MGEISARDILAKHRLNVPDHIGQHVTTCPKCSAHRTLHSRKVMCSVSMVACFWGKARCSIPRQFNTITETTRC